MNGSMAAAAAAATACGALAPAALAQRATFQGIGHLPGGDQSTAGAVSDDGRVVVGRALSPEGQAAVRWTAPTGLEALAPEPGWGGAGWKWRANAASADGTVIVGIGETPARTNVAFRWTSATGMVDLGALPSLTEARAWDLTPDGLTVVGDSQERAFRWTPAGGMEQAPPGLEYMVAFGVSADARTIVGMSGARGFRWTAAETHLFGTHVEPYRLSHDGSVFVGYEPGGVGAFRWAEGSGFVPIERPPGAIETGANDLSADGAVVVGWVEQDVGYDAFVWDEIQGTRLLHEVLIDDYGLDLTGWDLRFATGISADGTVIVGSGRNPAGHEEGWIARLGNGPCYADCDASGEIDFFDFLCYQDSFAAAEPWADCDGSGELDLFDFLCFQNAFASGCP